MSNIPPSAGSKCFRAPKSRQWRDLVAAADAGQETSGEVPRASEELNQTLLASLKMEHVVILAGSGCSMDVGGKKGPSMVDLWNAVIGKEPSEDAKKIAKKVGYNLGSKDANIEAFLSQVETWLSLTPEEDVVKFEERAKRVILEKCGEFLAGAALTAHQTFLHRLSRRRARDQRLKLFTTNYDLCFESAASKIGCIPIDGFSFTNPRYYDPRYFDYDIIRRPRSGDNHGNYLEGVFLLYKLHGSVNWERNEGGIFETKAPDPSKACLIYPAQGKYQQSYNQPYLESIAQYLAAMREPNTCVMVIGFGFNDDHLSVPLVSAVRSNPHLRLIVVDPSIAEKKETSGNINQFHKDLIELSEKGEDVWFINALFSDFADMIPDLKSLTPAERLFKAVQGIQRAE